MATMYRVKLDLVLKPVHLTGPVQVRVGINSCVQQLLIDQVTTVNFDFDTDQDCQLTVELMDKNDQEAVIVESVEFFGISDPKFAWAGVYEPVYPEPWASQQKSQGVALNPQLCPHTYLSWPGKWTLTFSVPVFTWIHHVQDQGWIYD